MPGPQVREWRTSRSAIPLLVAAFMLAIGLVTLLAPLNPERDRLKLLMVVPIICSSAVFLGVLVAQTTRRFLLQIVAVAVPTVATVTLLSRSALSWPAPWLLWGEKVLTYALIILAGRTFVALVHHLKAPLVLRLTEAGIEREGYPRSTPTIPYSEIARVDTLLSGHRLGLTLREPNPGLGRALRGYDVAIGHDVGARIPELRDLIAARVPDDAIIRAD